MKLDKKILESILNPLGDLGLTQEQKQMLFFRDLNAQYSSASRYGRTPKANNIQRAASTFSGLGSGGDVLSMIMLQNMLEDDKPEVKAEPETAELTSDEMVNKLADALYSRLDTLTKPQGKGGGK